MQNHRKVDYSLRPAKHAERRMLAELFSRLYPFQAVRMYQYVGFGSLWFEDFRLFHRTLGFQKMTSIEQSGPEKRFLENRPYKSVKILFGRSNTNLQQIKWDMPTILWLDYNSPISESSLLDIDIAAENLVSGSIIAVTYDIQEAAEISQARDESEDELEKERAAVNLFCSRFSEFYSEKIFFDDMVRNPFRKICENIISAKIQSALSNRNIYLEDDEKIAYELLCQFQYADTRLMATFVYVLFERGDREKFDQCQFSTLDFLPRSSLGEVVRIEMPKLTLKEMRNIEAQLPTRNPEKIKTEGVPLKDVRNFVNIYRYLPNFAVLET